VRLLRSRAAFAPRRRPARTMALRAPRAAPPLASPTAHGAATAASAAAAAPRRPTRLARAAAAALPTSSSSSFARAPPLRSFRHRTAARRATATATSASALPPAAWRGDPPAASSLPLLPSGRPDYSSIDALPQSKLLTAVVRKLLVAEVGADDDPRPWTSFDALMTPVRQVNDAPGSAEDVQARARRVFQGILPALGLGFVPPAWRKFIKPTFPTWVLHFSFFSVFYLLFPWLMGPLKGAEHVEVDAPASLRPLLRALRLPVVWRVPQAVQAERCRFLESAQCASVCVNSCKAPTQAWMKDDFGLDLHIQARELKRGRAYIHSLNPNPNSHFNVPPAAQLFRLFLHLVLRQSAAAARVRRRAPGPLLRRLPLHRARPEGRVAAARARRPRRRHRERCRYIHRRAPRGHCGSSQRRGGGGRQRRRGRGRG
jgi:hypothetical protein